MTRWPVRSARAFAGVLVALAVVTGCGARIPPKATDRTGSVNNSKPAAQTTLEETSPALSSALAALSRRETPDALRAVATEYHRLKVYDRAEAYLTRALTLDRLSADSFELRARVYRDWGVLDGALGDSTRAVYFAPDSATAQNTLGTVLFVLGREMEAEQAFRKALALDPTAAWASSNLCYLALTQGNEEDAVNHCEHALTVDPTLAPARNNLALTHAAAGRLSDARREFLGAGSRAHALYNVGIIYLARADYERAIEAFDAAQREAPNFDAAFVRAQEARRLANRR